MTAPKAVEESGEKQDEEENEEEESGERDGDTGDAKTCFMEEKSVGKKFMRV